MSRGLQARPRHAPPDPAFSILAAMATARPSAGSRPSALLASRAAVRAVRPAEWVKNLFVFVALLFSGRVEEVDTTLRCIAVFAAFCAVASAGYVVNDLLDVELDRQHPDKRRRPIASGELPVAAARMLAAILALGGLALAFVANWKAGAIVAGYGTLTTSYSVWLKHVVIVDVMTIVSLFILRVLAGAVPFGIHVSDWLVVCTAMVSLFLGFAKRRQEAASELHSGQASRPVLEHYSLPFLDQMVSLVTAGTVMSYVIYAQSSPLVGHRMLLSVPPVLYGIFRYLYLIYHRGDTRSTAHLVARDPGMIAAAAAWVAVVAVLIYTR